MEDISDAAYTVNAYRPHISHSKVEMGISNRFWHYSFCVYTRFDKISAFFVTGA